MPKTFEAQHNGLVPAVVEPTLSFYQADLTQGDFDTARGLISTLADYDTYEDWRDEREGVCIGLSYAGATASMTPIRLDRFVDWRRIGGGTIDYRALDDFAELVALYRDASDLPCLAELTASDFAAYSLVMPATTAFGCYGRWESHRSHLRQVVEQRAHRLIISVPEFLKWTRCLSLEANESNLDAYAALKMEFWAESPHAPTLTAF